jgi:hypothetical protein
MLMNWKKTVAQFCLSNLWFFIESKKTHIINCITVQYLFVFCCRCVFFCKTVTCYSVEQFPHHINPYCTSVLYISFCMMYVYWMTQYNIKMSLCMSYWSNFGDWYTFLLLNVTLFCCTVIVHGEKSTSCIFSVVVIWGQGARVSV